MNKKKRTYSSGHFIALVFLVLALFVTAVLVVKRAQTSEEGIHRHVTRQQLELNEFLAQPTEEYNHWRVKQWQLQSGETYSVFSVHAFGLAPSGHERGFVHLPQTPKSSTLSPMEDGWRWQDDGDNNGVLRHIVGDWYYFEWEW